MPSRPIHFEIQADDPQRAAKFYIDVFGWVIEEWPDMQYWVCYTNGKKTAPGEVVGEPGINGGILKRKGEYPAEGASVNAFVCTMGVESIEDTLRKVIAGGGSVALPKFAIAGMAWQAYAKDTEGNIFGIHQPDTNAK